MGTEMFDENIFDGLSLSELFKEIHTKVNNKDKQIQEIVKRIVEMATNNNNAIGLLPLISDLLDVNVKNNEQLIKMATVVQRMLTNQRLQNVLDDNYDFSDEEMAQLKELRDESSKEIGIDDIKKAIGIGNNNDK